MFKNCKVPLYYILGAGSSRQLPGILDARRQQGSKAIVLIDHFFKDGGLKRKLGLAETDVCRYIDTTDEPRTERIDELMASCRQELDGKPACAVVGIGGGSTMDTAKAVSVLLNNPGTAESYQGWDLVKNPAVYKIGVPTISGTGAESSRTAVMTSPTRKLGINSDHSMFDQIILDPELLASVPKQQFFYTAMDCYVHDVESLRGSQIDAMSKACAEKSLELVRSAMLGKGDPGELMVASYFGGLAVANSNVGICHPLSYGLSGILGLHHGEAICIAFDQLEEYYGPFVREFREIQKRIGVKLPQGIAKRATAEQIDLMVAATLKNEKPLTNAFGPDWRKVFSPEKVKALLLRM